MGGAVASPVAECGLTASDRSRSIVLSTWLDPVDMLCDLRHTFASCDRKDMALTVLETRRIVIMIARLGWPDDKAIVSACLM